MPSNGYTRGLQVDSLEVGGAATIGVAAPLVRGGLSFGVFVWRFRLACIQSAITLGRDEAPLESDALS